MQDNLSFATEANLTDLAIDRWQLARDPRLRRVMTSLIAHLHSFVKDVELTEAEWMAAIDWLTETGKMSDDKRKEFILASDVLGVSMLVDSINHRLDSGATPTTVLGPFHIDDSPLLGPGGDMAAGIPGVPCFVTGTVRDLDGSPIEGALLDVWQADAEGLYEAQLGTTEARLRALYSTGADGAYCVRTIVPTGYSIPMDGTIGGLLARTDISPSRPAHIHFIAEAPGFERIVTHLFQRGAPYIDSDVVFGVKEPLIVDFKTMPPGLAPTGDVLDTPFAQVDFDFVLQRAAVA